MNKIDYNTKPTEKGIDNFIWCTKQKSNKQKMKLKN